MKKVGKEGMLNIELSLSNSQAESGTIAPQLFPPILLTPYLLSPYSRTKLLNK